MQWIFLLILFVGIILIVRKKRSFKFGMPPKSLETKRLKGLKKLSDNMEQSLGKSYMENTEQRVRKENRLKSMSMSGVSRT